MDEVNKVAKSDRIYPLTIVTDRYGGTYSGGKFLAFNLDRENIPDAVGGGDCEEMEFFMDDIFMIGKGDTPNDAYFDLYCQLYKNEDVVDKKQPIQNYNPIHEIEVHEPIIEDGKTEYPEIAN